MTLRDLLELIPEEDWDKEVLCWDSFLAGSFEVEDASAGDPSARSCARGSVVDVDALLGQVDIDYITAVFALVFEGAEEHLPPFD